MLTSLLIYPTIWLSKILYRLTLLTKRGSGTSLPGLFIEKYIPWILGYFNGRFDEIIMITGTNGKTTTRALIAHIYEANDVNIVTNRGGANIFRGIASSLVLDVDILGRTKSKTLILEVEEATLPKLTKYIKPHKIVFTNIFRDQLDAYGEIDHTLDFFRKALENCNDNIEIIINQDDEKLLTILPPDKLVTLFGLGDSIQKPQYEKNNIAVSVDPYSIFLATDVKIGLNGGTDIEIQNAGNDYTINTLLPGNYNIYNVLAAIAVTFPKFDQNSFEPISHFQPVFGRGEEITVGSAKFYMHLVKNPAGFDEVLNFIRSTNQEQPINIAFLINDNIADGKDMSWLWDINIEDFILNQEIAKVYTSGQRGLDMMLRMEYGGANTSISNHYSNMENMVDEFSKSDKVYYILSTYTALLRARSIIEQYTTLTKITDSGN
jgi:lipid II isoglutaminyl synthase (glutamine-hydrolysing)